MTAYRHVTMTIRSCAAGGNDRRRAPDSLPATTRCASIGGSAMCRWLRFANWTTRFLDLRFNHLGVGVVVLRSEGTSSRCERTTKRLRRLGTRETASREKYCFINGASSSDLTSRRADLRCHRRRVVLCGVLTGARPRRRPCLRKDDGDNNARIAIAFSPANFWRYADGQRTDETAVARFLGCGDRSQRASRTARSLRTRTRSGGASSRLRRMQ